MHTRFSPDARNLVVAATNAAALLGAEQIEAEHFLVALLVGPGCKAQEYLRRHELTRRDVEHAIADSKDADVTFDDEDAAALGALGFDLPQILQLLEERFGPTPAPRPARRGPHRLRARFGDSAKRLLSQALVEASFREQQLTPEHVLLGILRDPSPTCADLIGSYGLSYEDACEYMLPPPQSDVG